MIHNLEAYVSAALFTREGSAFALGDGTVVFETGERVAAHAGAILCAAPHPKGHGVLTGGDDGRLVWSRPSGAAVIADLAGKWIDAVDASADSGLIAFAAGKTVHVRDVADAAFARAFVHERSVAGLAFDPKGRRLAAATYGGLMLWYARIAEQKPHALKWAGSHVACAWSPDSRFLMSAMQENALHGWRLSDNKDLKMGGYPAKPRTMVFLARGALMATSGASGAVVWPFAGSNGPMGKEAVEIGHAPDALVTAVAAHPAGMVLVAGCDDGRIWCADLQGRGVRVLKVGKASPVTALSVSPDGATCAFGTEAGEAGVLAIVAG